MVRLKRQESRFELIISMRFESWILMSTSLKKNAPKRNLPNFLRKWQMRFEKVTGRGQGDLVDVFSQVDESTAEFAPVLKLPVPKVSLVEYLGDE